MNRISAEEANKLLEAGWIYLDVRSEPEFEQGHPKGALNIPLLKAGPGGMVPNPDFLRVTRATLPLGSKIVVGCQSGGRSFQAAQILQDVGYADVVDQRAGFGGARDRSGRIVEPGWAAVQLPTESGPSPGRAYLDLEKAALR